MPVLKPTVCLSFWNWKRDGIQLPVMSCIKTTAEPWWGFDEFVINRSIFHERSQNAEAILTWRCKDDFSLFSSHIQTLLWPTFTPVLYSPSWTLYNSVFGIFLNSLWFLTKLSLFFSLTVKFDISVRLYLVLSKKIVFVLFDSYKKKVMDPTAEGRQTLNSQEKN